MELKSIDSKFSAEIKLKPWGAWDSSDYVKGFDFGVTYAGLNFSSKYSGEGSLKPVKEDELLIFIASLEWLFEKLSGEAFYEFSLSGEPEPDGELTFYIVKQGFYSLDSLGNIGFHISCKREHRYSDTKDFIHKSSLEFQVYQEGLRDFCKYLKAQYNESNIKNENY
jgi:hypothetical protein